MKMSSNVQGPGTFAPEGDADEYRLTDGSSLIEIKDSNRDTNGTSLILPNMAPRTYTARVGVNSRFHSDTDTAEPSLTLPAKRITGVKSRSQTLQNCAIDSVFTFSRNFCHTAWTRQVIFYTLSCLIIV